jgi:hypothetical protein
MSNGSKNCQNLTDGLFHENFCPMSNRSPDILFQLIKSLEKAEKRHFKLYINRSSAKEDLKIVRLFDALDKLEAYDEKSLLKKLPGTEKRQLYNLKTHLYKEIMASLRLLKSTEFCQQVLNILDEITTDIAATSGNKSDDFRVLRQALGYGWSVAIVSASELGKVLFEKWVKSSHKDIQWIVNENLKKNRLMRLDPQWVEKMGKLMS